MKLIVGLGNPGREYAATRHNVGFDVIDSLAAKLGWIGKAEDYDRLAKTRFDGLSLDGVLNLSSGEREKMLLLKPMTYMNVSGRAVQAAIAFYQVAPNDIMIVLDDLALPCGKIRMRESGSSGGHNGLKDIERAISTNAYPRLRLGIDAPPPFVPGKDYVLQRFTPEQRKLIDQAIGRACGAIVTWADKGIGPAMSQFNAGEKESGQ
jgi:peptidyl-tRNA hydrolase, PTH1 family